MTLVISFQFFKYFLTIISIFKFGARTMSLGLEKKKSMENNVCTVSRTFLDKMKTSVCSCSSL